MKPVQKRKATGVLAALLKENRDTELIHTRKRMMLAAKIADAMSNAGYSQKAFAAKMGKSEAVISEWLSGERNFTVDTLADIEEALRVRLLDVTMMTAIQSGTELSLKVGSQKAETVNAKGTWTVCMVDDVYRYNLNCA